MGFDIKYYDVDLCVVGGGLSGICAAIAAAREGAKVALMHERPMLGGNASSEIRMWVCGAGGSNNRETGILEEISLLNLYRNPYKLYSVWDSILYEKVNFEPNITLLLNCSCCDAEMNGNNIVSVKGWQLTTQSWQIVNAKIFMDCSGDSVLAPLTGADFRIGRESKHEYGEIISVEVEDKKTMGMSCLIQARKLDFAVDYIAPDWALKLTAEDLKYRRPNLNSTYENFWYLELGGDRDSIADSETVRDELLALAYGIWDYVKNSGEFDSANWQLDFVGYLPGKRESRRMMGKYIMTQPDVTSGGKFDDVVAYGGWPMDDHDPNGFWHVGAPNVNGATPSPYGIPYRVLYSRNIDNLMFAGRNISMTHAAMSSARVMATCALLGQAAGTAAAIAVKYGTSPDGVYEDHLKELKDTLMFNDCFLPYNKRDVTTNAVLSGGNGVENLRNGIDRNNHTYGKDEQGYKCGIGEAIEYKFDEAAFVHKVRFVFDSDLDRVTLPGDVCERQHSMRANVIDASLKMCMPKTLVKEFKIEITDENGKITEINESLNIKRLVLIDVSAKVKSVKFIPTATWGMDEVNIYAFEIV